MVAIEIIHVGVHHEVGFALAIPGMKGVTFVRTISGEMVATTIEALHHVLSLTLHSAETTVFVKSRSGLLGLGPCAVGLCSHLLCNMLSLLGFMS